MIFKIAWRNIWRNKRRTALTAASIFFAVLLSVATNSMNRGVFDKMINDSVRFYMGYAQVLQKGYWEERSLDKSFELTTPLRATLMATEGIDGVVPRIESFALASYGKITKSSMVVGIDPKGEDKLTGLKGRLSEGAYLEEGDKAVLISEGLASKLKLSIQDTIVLISQGYRGVNAAGKYLVKGIISFGSPTLNSKMVYMPLAAAQWFYGAENLITSAVLDIKNKDNAEKALKHLTATIDTTTAYEIMGWQEMMPDLMEMKALKESSNMITVFVLYFIVSFGIFGVILMMTKERRYEFGVLLSIGMKRGQLALTTWIETLLLGLLGAVIGIVVSYALMYYLYVNPIVVTGEMAETYAKFGIEPLLPGSVDWDLFYTQGLIVMVITTILALYPCIKIWRMKPIDSMRA